MAEEKGISPEDGLQRIRRHFRAAQRELDAAQAIPEQPFQVGDIVTLKSGGFPMTVRDCYLTCSPAGYLVDCVWAAHNCDNVHQLGEETFRDALLILAGPARPQTDAKSDGNIPF